MRNPDLCIEPNINAISNDIKQMRHLERKTEDQTKPCPTEQLNNNPPPLPPPPSSQPGQNSNPDANRAANSPEPIAPPSIALTIGQAITVAAIHSILISGRVNNTPECGTSRRHHGNNTPVCGEVLYTPDDGDDDGSKREGAAVPESD